MSEVIVTKSGFLVGPWNLKEAHRLAQAVRGYSFRVKIMQDISRNMVIHYTGNRILDEIIAEEVLKRPQRVYLCIHSSKNLTFAQS